MEDLLKRLLEAELQADAEVRNASSQRERTIREALEQARQAEQQFGAGIETLGAPYLRQAQERSEQAIAELRKKYEERQRSLRALAEQRETAAVEAALAAVLDPEQN